VKDCRKRFPRRAASRESSEALIVVRRRRRILLVRRAAHQRWAGLWDFPRVPCDATETSPKPAELATKVHAATGIRIDALKLLTTFRHGVTRFRITLECYEARASGTATLRKPPVETAWVKPSELADYPLSSTGRKLARFVLAQR
jgi:A/G-specific adenine glycosylase